MVLEVLHNNNELDSVNNKLKRGVWIVLYFSESCGYCHQFMPIWDEFVNNNNTKVKCAKIDSNVSDNITANPGFLGVPSVHFYRNGKLAKNGVFEEERTVENLNKFVNKNLVKKTKKRKTKKKSRKK